MLDGEPSTIKEVSTRRELGTGHIIPVTACREPVVQEERT